MAEVIGVRFQEAGKVYYFDPDGKKINKGEFVIVETQVGLECAEVSMENRKINDNQIVKPLKKVVRVATDEDKAQLERNKVKEKEAFDICLKKIEDHSLDMKLTNVEYTFDGNKILFYFTSDGRVDFRDLVKDLASTFHTRIELRQIGVRDEAKMLGGIGICGQPFCCHRFLDEFQPVSIKMAKEQSLSLNPTKISGTCGRLMCCLKYEQDTYVALSKETPRVGSLVKTPDGKGTIVEANIFTGMLKIRSNDNPELLPKTYHKDEVKVLGFKQKNKEEPKEIDENQ